MGLALALQHRLVPCAPTPLSYHRTAAPGTSTSLWYASHLPFSPSRLGYNLVHIMHLSAVHALPIVHSAKAAGHKLTVETCFHYLCLASDTIPTMGVLDAHQLVSSTSEYSEDADGASFYDNYHYSQLSILSKMSKSLGYTATTAPHPIPKVLKTQPLRLLNHSCHHLRRYLSPHHLGKSLSLQQFKQHIPFCCHFGREYCIGTRTFGSYDCHSHLTITPRSLQPTKIVTYGSKHFMIRPPVGATFDF